MIKIFNNNNYYTKYHLFSLKTTNIYLIKWEPKMKTIPHYHSNMKCNFYLLKGSLQEKVFKNNKLIKLNKYNNFFSKGYIDDNIGSHVVYNDNDINSFSLHIYKKN